MVRTFCGVGVVGELKEALAFAGVQPVMQAWGKVAAIEIGSDGPPLVRGGPAEQPPDKEKNALHWIQVCGGTFWMGSDGKQAGGDEKPTHPVTLSSFWITRTEVTNAQYAESLSEPWPVDDKPAANVKWEHARAFCGQQGGRLPTEAEWEYAARGGSAVNEARNLRSWYRDGVRPAGRLGLFGFRCVRASAASGAQHLLSACGANAAKASDLVHGMTAFTITLHSCLVRTAHPTVPVRPKPIVGCAVRTHPAAEQCCAVRNIC